MRTSGIPHLVISFIAVALMLASGGSQPVSSYESTDWVGNRVTGLEASLGVPLPSNLEELLDFAGITAGVDSETSAEDRCLAQAIYFEARGEPIDGQFAVARVVMNRVDDPRYPDTICGVVFQNQKWVDRCQFSFACDGNSDKPVNQSSWTLAKRIANMVKASWLPDNSGAATHYHADYVNPRWANGLTKTVRVGNHIFYREDAVE